MDGPLRSPSPSRSGERAGGIVRDPDCLFCSIVTGEAEASVVARRPAATAFLDLHPMRPGHTLVVSDSHEPNFEELDDDVTCTVALLSKQIACALKRLYHTEKVGLAVAGLDVPHAHFHVVPLHDYHDLTSKRLLDGLVKRAPRDELEGVAQRLRLELAAESSGAA